MARECCACCISTYHSIDDNHIEYNIDFDESVQSVHSPTYLSVCVSVDMGYVANAKTIVHHEMRSMITAVD